MITTVLLAKQTLWILLSYYKEKEYRVIQWFISPCWHSDKPLWQESTL